VAILGGTFDPVHWGHLLIAEAALSQVALEKVIWVPTRCPPHKQAALFQHRLEMVQRAIADHPAFAILSDSAHRSHPSYAIQTLTNLQAVYPNTHWYWIVGLDAFRTLPRWHRRQELASECNWLVAPRLLSTTPEMDDPPGMTTQTKFICEQVVEHMAKQNITIHWQILHMPWVGVSSSLIRQYCRAHSSIRYLVPEAVRTYIAIHNLYLP
jgi:nicotinate-nucleotide adenylyltransferase